MSFRSKRIALWAMVAATGSLLAQCVMDADVRERSRRRPNRARSCRFRFARASMSACALSPSAGYSQTDSSVDSNPKVQQRLQEVEAMKKDLLRKMQDFDNRIHTLEAEVKRQKSQTGENRCQGRQPLRSSRCRRADGCGCESRRRPSLHEASLNLSDFNVKIFGKAKLDAIYNTARPQAPGVPFFLVPTVCRRIFAEHH